MSELKKLWEKYPQTELMNRLQANIYITDVETDEVIFMNTHMKTEFGAENPEGRTCWEIFGQTGGRCRDCKVPELLQNEDKEALCVWDQFCPENGRTYKNTDLLFALENGRLLHMQYSLDVTEERRLSMHASTDELTGMLNRAAGKSILEKTFEQAKERKQPFVLALYDVNDLKKVNDLYGHREGDHMLKYISDTVRENLSGTDLLFRLGGDEFVVIFGDTEKEAAEQKLKNALEEMERGRRAQGIFYSTTFSYGVLKVTPEEEMNTSDLLLLVDEKMYEQKRGFHIRKMQQYLTQPAHYPGRTMQLCRYENDQLFHLLEMSTDDYLFVGYLKSGIFQFSKGMVDEFGLSGKMVENALAVWGERIHPDEKREFFERTQEIIDGRISSQEIEYRAINRKGEWVWLRCTGNMVQDVDGQPELFIGVIQNLGKREKKDPVTGLFCKFELEGCLKEWTIRKRGRKFTLMILGVDRFTQINEQYDQTFGDEVLRILAKKISFILPDYAYLYRLDGDIFGIAMEDENEEAAEQLYIWIQYLFKDRQELNGRRFDISFSAGYTVFPEDGESYRTLIKNVSYALEYSKRTGRNRITRYVPAMSGDRQRNVELMELLQESVSRNYQGFSVVYQPVMETEKNELYGAEALLRWQDDEGRHVSPREVVPLLEQSGLIVKVGQWFLRKVVEQCSLWNTKETRFHMSINISQLQLDRRQLQRTLSKLFSEFDVPAENFLLELKDTSMILKMPEFIESLKEISEMGVRFVLDNFGTGDSSFQNLKLLPISVVKIDENFVRGIEKPGFEREMIRLTVKLCRKIGRELCLEGIESDRILREALKLTPDYLQGFYMGVPMESAEFEKSVLGKEN